MLLLFPLPIAAECVSVRAQFSHPFCEERSRGRSYLLFQTHGLHLKKIDGLGLQVPENSGGKATTEHPRSVDVDAIGLDVRHALR